MKRGFTLIELLVVVLIIGILSSVALPQYTKAVMKARISEALVNLKAIASADKVCRMQKGSELCTLEELDIEISGDCSESVCTGKNFSYTASSGYGDFENVHATAGYVGGPEDLCLCYLTDDRIVLNQSGSGCGNEVSSIDFSKLLNIPEAEDEICSCC